MAKLDVNDDFRSLCLKRYFANLSNSNDGITVKIFDGVAPDYAQIKAWADAAGYHPDGWTQSGDLRTQILGAGHTEVFTIQYNNMTQRRQTTKTSMDFFFAQRGESAFGLTATPTPGTWFWAYQHNDNNPDFVAYWSVFGTVGLVDSGADMELEDTDFVDTRQYKLNDINLNFNINPVPQV